MPALSGGRDARRCGLDGLRQLAPFFWAGILGLTAPSGGHVSAGAATPGPDIRRDAVVQAIEEVMPSVVNISTETIVEVRDPLDQVFRDFFGPSW